MEDEEINGELSSEAHSEGQSRDWEMVEENNNNSNPEEEEDEDFSVFPPSHHEGLHSDGQPTLSPPLSPPSLNANGQRPSHHGYRESLDSGLRVARDVVMKRLNLGIEIVSSKIVGVVSLARSGRANSLCVPVAGVTVAFVVSYWFLKWQRLRRQGSQETKIDQLLNLVRHQDEDPQGLLVFLFNMDRDRVQVVAEIIDAHPGLREEGTNTGPMKNCKGKSLVEKDELPLGRAPPKTTSVESVLVFSRKG